MLRHEVSPTDETAALCLNMTETKKIEVKAGLRNRLMQVLLSKSKFIYLTLMFKN
jgi:hypothetical protein